MVGGEIPTHPQVKIKRTEGPGVLCTSSETRQLPESKEEAGLPPPSDFYSFWLSPLGMSPRASWAVRGFVDTVLPACRPACLPAFLFLFFFSPCSPSLAPSPAAPQQPNTPTPSSTGEIAKLVAIMTLHSGGRLPLNLSAPWPSRPNQRAPPCCPPSPRPPLPPHTKNAGNNPPPCAFLRPSVEQTAAQSPRSEKQWGARGGTSIRRSGVFVRAGDLAFLPHLLFGTPIKSHSFRTFPARSRLSAGAGPTMARRSEASPFTRLGTLTIGRVAALASHRHSPGVTRSRIKPRPPGEKGGRPRGKARPRRGAARCSAPGQAPRPGGGRGRSRPRLSLEANFSSSSETLEVGQSPSLTKAGPLHQVSASG